MRLPDLAAHAGGDRFQQACDVALATAAGTGTRLGRDEWPADLSAVPHELADLVENDLPLAFELYRAMPCYANLMYVGHWGVGPAFWAELRSLLDDADQRLRDPVLYWLWSGPFESGEREAGEAWRELATSAGDGRLRALLPASGPVPWQLKAPLLDRLSRQATWHSVVRAAIEWAAYDVHGSIDVPEARRLLARIHHVPPELLARLDELEAPTDRASGAERRQGRSASRRRRGSRRR